MANGYLSLVLHTHLPFVRHANGEHFLEEKWFYEAMTESYIPLLMRLERLAERNLDFTITISLSPTLMTMMSDPVVQERYHYYLHNLLELANREVHRTAGDPHFAPLPHMYREKLEGIRHFYEEKYGRNILDSFQRLSDSGHVELMTTAATHGYFPLLAVNPKSIRAQIAMGLAEFRRHFGFQPRGFWLPECGYYPGAEEILSDHGISYFVLEAHGVLHAAPQPRYGLYAPIYCRGGVAGFGRDIESSKQVWSSNEGYPGDYNYREFYRDIGYDLPCEDLEPFLTPDSPRTHTGLKYYKITGRKTPLEEKDPYIPHLARQKADEHAANFLFNRQQQITYLAEIMDRKPLVTCPYDTELFGHWWFEGPDWLSTLIEKVHYDQNELALISPGSYLERYQINQHAEPPMSSWGYKGYNEVWLEGSNDWIYPHLHMAADRMGELARDYANYVEKDHAENGHLERALNQAGRELLLAQSSDWPFIMKTGTMVEYAKKRFCDHIADFNRLYEDIKNERIDPGHLEFLEERDPVFPTMDFQIYS